MEEGRPQRDLNKRFDASLEFMVGTFGRWKALGAGKTAISEFQHNAFWKLSCQFLQYAGALYALYACGLFDVLLAAETVCRLVLVRLRSASHFAG